MDKFKCKAVLAIMETFISCLIDEKMVQQPIIEELAKILGISRCTLFKFSNGHANHDFNITIKAGFPVEAHGIGLTESIEKHPDIKEAVRYGKVMIIDDPKNSPLTDHFRSIIEKNDIRQIMYVLLVSKKKEKIIGMIVIDAAGEKTHFEPEEIEFCGEAGELISLFIIHEEILLERWEHECRNRFATLGAYAERLKKFSEKLSKDLKTIIEEVQWIEEFFKKKTLVNF